MKYHYNKQKPLNLNLNLTREEKIIVNAFSKLFKNDKEKFVNSIDLFPNPDFHLARIFECLSEMKREKFINALISLEYLLQIDKDNKTIKDIMEEK